MQSIAHPTAGGEIVIRFEGDLWEMEDQRNWTDASYKTYSTPLRPPYPVEIREGDRVLAEGDHRSPSWRRRRRPADRQGVVDRAAEPSR